MIKNLSYNININETNAVDAIQRLDLEERKRFDKYQKMEQQAVAAARKAEINGDRRRKKLREVANEISRLVDERKKLTTLEERSENTAKLKRENIILKERIDKEKEINKLLRERERELNRLQKSEQSINKKIEDGNKKTKEREEQLNKNRDIAKKYQENLSQYVGEDGIVHGQGRRKIGQEIATERSKLEAILSSEEKRRNKIMKLEGSGEEKLNKLRNKKIELDTKITRLKNKQESDLRKSIAKELGTTEQSTKQLNNIVESRKFIGQQLGIAANYKKYSESERREAAILAERQKQILASQLKEIGLPRANQFLEEQIKDAKKINQMTSRSKNMQKAISEIDRAGGLEEYQAKSLAKIKKLKEDINNLDIKETDLIRKKQELYERHVASYRKLEILQKEELEQLKTNKKVHEDITRQISIQKTQVDLLAKEYDQVNRELNETKNTVKKLNKEKAGFTDSKLLTENSRQLDVLNRRMQEVAKSGRRSSKIFRGMSMDFGDFARAAIAFNAVDAVGDMVREGAMLAAKYERTTASFEVMLGSAQKAKQLMLEIERFATTTPFYQSELEESARIMMAMGFAAAEIPDALRRIGDVSAGSDQPFKEIAHILGQIRSAGQAYTLDLNQLAFRGIPIWQALANTMGITVREVKKMVSESKIGAGQVESAFFSMSQAGGKFFGLTEKLSEVTIGKYSTMMDTIRNSIRRITEPLLPSVNKIFDAIIFFFEKIQGLSKYVDLKTIIAMTVGIIAARKAVRGLTIAEYALAKAKSFVNKAESELIISQKKRLAELKRESLNIKEISKLQEYRRSLYQKIDDIEKKQVVTLGEINDKNKESVITQKQKNVLLEHYSKKLKQANKDVANLGGEVTNFSRRVKIAGQSVSRARIALLAFKNTIRGAVVTMRTFAATVASSFIFGAAMYGLSLMIEYLWEYVEALNNGTLGMTNFQKAMKNFDDSFASSMEESISKSSSKIRVFFSQQKIQFENFRKSLASIQARTGESVAEVINRIVTGKADKTNTEEVLLSRSMMDQVSQFVMMFKENEAFRRVLKKEGFDINEDTTETSLYEYLLNKQIEDSGFLDRLTKETVELNKKIARYNIVNKENESLVKAANEAEKEIRERQFGLEEKYRREAMKYSTINGVFMKDNGIANMTSIKDLNKQMQYYVIELDETGKIIKNIRARTQEELDEYRKLGNEIEKGGREYNSLIQSLDAKNKILLTAFLAASSNETFLFDWGKIADAERKAGKGVDFYIDYLSREYEAFEKESKAIESERDELTKGIQKRIEAQTAETIAEMNKLNKLIPDYNQNQINLAAGIDPTGGYDTEASKNGRKIKTPEQIEKEAKANAKRRAKLQKDLFDLSKRYKEVEGSIYSSNKALQQRINLLREEMKILDKRKISLSEDNEKYLNYKESEKIAIKLFDEQTEIEIDNASIKAMGEKLKLDEIKENKLEKIKESVEQGIITSQQGEIEIAKIEKEYGLELIKFEKNKSEELSKIFKLRGLERKKMLQNLLHDMHQEIVYQERNLRRSRLERGINIIEIDSGDYKNRIKLAKKAYAELADMKKEEIQQLKNDREELISINKDIELKLSDPTIDSKEKKSAMSKYFINNNDIKNLGLQIEKELNKLADLDVSSLRIVFDIETQEAEDQLSTSLMRIEKEMNEIQDKRERLDEKFNDSIEGRFSGVFSAVQTYIKEINSIKLNQLTLEKEWDIAILERTNVELEKAKAIKTLAQIKARMSELELQKNIAGLSKDEKDKLLKEIDLLHEEIERLEAEIRRLEKLLAQAKGKEGEAAGKALGGSKIPIGPILDIVKEISTVTFDIIEQAYVRAIKRLDDLIAAQQNRVDQIRSGLNSAGEAQREYNAEQLQLEEERLFKLQQMREQQVRKQAALAKIELAANLALGVSKVIASKPEPILAAIQIAALLAAAVAGFAQAKSASETAIPTFAQGGIVDSNPTAFMTGKEISRLAKNGKPRLKRGLPTGSIWGKRHSAGGVLIEAEGGEAIISRGDMEEIRRRSREIGFTRNLLNENDLSNSNNFSKIDSALSNAISLTGINSSVQNDSIINELRKLRHDISNIQGNGGRLETVITNKGMRIFQEQANKPVKSVKNRTTLK